MQHCSDLGQKLCGRFKVAEEVRSEGHVIFHYENLVVLEAVEELLEYKFVVVADPVVY